MLASHGLFLLLLPLFFLFFFFFFLVSNFLRIELNIGSLCIGSEMHSSTLNPVGWLCDPPNENDQFV